MNKIHRLDISWSTSRGRDTYGYSICRLDDSETRARYRCMGGGYDMIGTVFAQWFQATYQDKLRAMVDARKSELIDCGYQVPGYMKLPDMYGFNVTPDGRITLDGACGIESMRRIVEACGFEVQWSGNRKGHTIGYYVQAKEA